MTSQKLYDTENGMPPTSKQIILSARAELTFDNGIREYIVKVKLDDGKERLAYYYYQNQFPVLSDDDRNREYRFTLESDAVNCAVWLIGREYIGPN